MKWPKAIVYFSFRKACSIRGIRLFQKKMHLLEYAVFSKVNPHLAFRIAKT